MTAGEQLLLSQSHKSKWSCRSPVEERPSDPKNPRLDSSWKDDADDEDNNNDDDEDADDNNDDDEDADDNDDELQVTGGARP